MLAADFFEDPGVEMLYELAEAAEADGAVVLFIRMCIRAHKLDRPDVLAEFARSKNERRQRLIVLLRDAGLIDEAGIRPTSFQRWRKPDRGFYDSDRGVAGGLARAATAERNAGRFTSVSPAFNQQGEHSGNGAERSGAPYSGSSTVDELNEEERNASERGTVPEAWSDLAALVEELTQTAYALSNPWSKMSEMALALIERHGWPAFEEKARWVAKQIPHPTVSEIVFGVEKATRRSPNVAEAAKEERSAEVADSTRRAVERTQLALHFQHLDPKDHPGCPACREQIA